MSLISSVYQYIYVLPAAISCYYDFLFQDNVLNIINQIMDECIPHDRANRDFCVKFPEEIRHDNLAGQLWFGAEVGLWYMCNFMLNGDWFTVCIW